MDIHTQNKEWWLYFDAANQPNIIMITKLFMQRCVCVCVLYTFNILNVKRKSIKVFFSCSQSFFSVQTITNDIYHFFFWLVSLSNANIVIIVFIIINNLMINQPASQPTTCHSMWMKIHTYIWLHQPCTKVIFIYSFFFLLCFLLT